MAPPLFERLSVNPIGKVSQPPRDSFSTELMLCFYNCHLFCPEHVWWVHSIVSLSTFHKTTCTCQELPVGLLTLGQTLSTPLRWPKKLDRARRVVKSELYNTWVFGLHRILVRIRFERSSTKVTTCSVLEHWKSLTPPLRPHPSPSK